MDLELENLLSPPAIVTIFGLLLFSYALSSMISRSRPTCSAAGKAPPEVAGARPLIGHNHILSGSALPRHALLGNMADKYGPAFTIRLGVQQALVVSSSELAQECFTVNDKALAGRPSDMAFEILGYNFSMMGFSPYGPYWRHVRRIATSEVLSARRLETLIKPVMESEVKAAIKDSYSSEKAVTTNMKKWFEDLVINIMFRIVVGKCFVRRAGSSDQDGDVVDSERIRKAMMQLFSLSGSFPVADAMPYLRWLDLDGREKAMKSTIKELDYFLKTWLQEHRRCRNCGPPGESKDQDFMDVLLSNVNQEFEGRDVDTIIKANSLSLILAATHTTTTTLTWALSLLLNNRQVLNKAIHELDTQIGRERMAIESDLSNLVYLQAIIKETLRMYPPVPLNAPHQAMEECVVGGYRVPAGTRLITNIAKIQRDPALYPDPLEFRPERFLTTHKGVDLRGRHFELIPFGAGRRMCPGLSFGLRMLQLTLANLLHSFDIVTADGRPVDMLERAGTTSVKAGPLQVILTPRLSGQVYGEN